MKFRKKKEKKMKRFDSREGKTDDLAVRLLGPSLFVFGHLHGGDDANCASCCDILCFTQCVMSVIHVLLLCDTPVLFELTNRHRVDSLPDGAAESALVPRANCS